MDYSKEAAETQSAFSDNEKNLKKDEKSISFFKFIVVFWKKIL